MRKSTRVLNRLLSLFLVVLISINSYAAIVGDNDGAAFVTKAEFDSLRNTFDAQINQYNSSIDNKIDGAIGSYLAGVKTNDKPYIMLDDIKGAVGRDLRFNNTKSYGSALNTQYQFNKEKSFSVLYQNSEEGGWKKKTFTEIVSAVPTGFAYSMQVASRTNNQNYRVIIRHDKKLVYRSPNLKSNSTGFSFAICDSLSTKTNTVNFPIKLTSTEPDDGLDLVSPTSYSRGIGQYEKTKLEWQVAAGAAQVWYVVIELSDYGFSTTPGAGSMRAWALWTAGGVMEWAVRPDTSVWANGIDYLSCAPPDHKPHYILSDSWSNAGSGAAWISMKLPNNKNTLLGYRSTYPLVILNYSAKYYKNAGTVTLADGVFAYTTTHTKTISPPTSWTYQKSGTRHYSYSTNDSDFYYDIVVTQYQGNMSNTNVQYDQWSGDFTNNIRYLDLYATPTTSGNVNSNASYAQSTHQLEGYNHNVSPVNITMAGLVLNPATGSMNTFEQLYLTGIAGEVVYMGGGAPLMRMRAEQSTEYTVKMDLLSRNSSGTAANSTVTVRLSYKQFKNGTFNATTDKIYEANISCNSSGKGTATFDITGIPKDSIVWYSLLSTTTGYSAECTNCTVTIK